MNTVASGPVHTPLQPASRPEEEMEEFPKQSMLGRGLVSQVELRLVFLVSAEAALYVGQALYPYPLG